MFSWDASKRFPRITHIWALFFFFFSALSISRSIFLFPSHFLLSLLRNLKAQLFIKTTSFPFLTIFSKSIFSTIFLIHTAFTYHFSRSFPLFLPIFFLPAFPRFSLPSFRVLFLSCSREVWIFVIFFQIGIFIIGVMTYVKLLNAIFKFARFQRHCVIWKLPFEISRFLEFYLTSPISEGPSSCEGLFSPLPTRAHNAVSLLQTTKTGNQQHAEQWRSPPSLKTPPTGSSCRPCWFSVKLGFFKPKLATPYWRFENLEKFSTYPTDMSLERNYEHLLTKSYIFKLIQLFLAALIRPCIISIGYLVLAFVSALLPSIVPDAPGKYAKTLQVAWPRLRPLLIFLDKISRKNQIIKNKKSIKKCLDKKK